MNSCQAKERWIEENRDALEKQYYESYKMALQDSLEGCWEAFKMFEDALVRIGILQPEQLIENPEDATGAENWDELMIDQRIDELRDREALMAHER